jgi:type I restriction enzyme S subunit
MRSSFAREPISQLLEKIVDNRGKTVPTADNGIPLIATNCIKENSLYPTFENIRYVSEDTHRTWFRDHLQPEDIFFVNKGTPGRVCMVPDPVNFCAAQDMIALRADRSKVYPRYLFSFLRSDWAKEKIRNYHVGLAIPHFKKQDLDTITVPKRSHPEQKAIGDLYFLLSEKIELNNRINAELEALAKLLYDYWFVQFDFPISATQADAMGKPELEGKPYRASGGKMVYNEKLKREIPKGWIDGSLVDVAIFTNGIACQKYPADGGETLGVIKIKEMRTGLTPDSDIVTANVPEKVKIKNGDILFSWSASLEVMIWAGGNGALNQHIFKVTSETYPRSFCYFVLLDYLQHFRMIAELRKTTMGHITIDHLEQSQITIPDHGVAEAFEQTTKPIIDRMVKSHEETQELTELRDWLLPMLMNGQVTVRS